MLRVMKNNILQDQPGLRKAIRFGEIIVVGALLAYAAITWRELRILRAVPVTLPTSWFIVTAGVDEVNRVEAGGSWVSKDAPSGDLQTTIIDCVKSKMQCMESSALVSMNEGGVLENAQTLFDVESWTDTEVITKPAVKPCATRRLILDITNKQAQSVAKPGSSPTASCKSTIVGEMTSRLVGGEQAHADAVKKAKPF